MSGEMTLNDVGQKLWQARRFIMTGAFVAFVLAAVFILNAVPHYKSKMVIAPANPMNGAEASSLLADENLFALRYLMQRVGVANSSDFVRFEAIYSGPSVAAYLLKDEQIREGLAADKSFSFSGVKTSRAPEELAEYIGRRVKLEPVSGTSLRRLTYAHPDKNFGIYFLHNIHRMSDELIRLRLKTEAAQRIKYLQEAISTTRNPENRRALTTLLMEQERLRMLVSIESAYAAAVVEPPAAGVDPVWPSAPLIFAVFLFAGALSGFFVWQLYGMIPVAEETETEAGKRRWFRTDSGNMNARVSDSDAAA